MNILFLFFLKRHKARFITGMKLTYVLQIKEDEYFIKRHWILTLYVIVIYMSTYRTTMNGAEILLIA